ncbi:MAG: polymerase beta domain protein region protein [Candidatus Nomurabacteria bacterium GW2011_GWA2_40_9]|uniref:Polymerase beta domain protein region protein n=1 Tax=Candidatus Nomurabacteria bacterium GW2011_GWA2_40_9 TaxID=1618734 RepID=A0A0G0WSY6_9BACT|nr:MAG: polymerase beta domain protein region protein [Candidatus Nomurabacteria bacterium GW2011_GWA2_40_9]
MDRTKIKKEIIEIASNYKNVLEKAGIPVVHLLLFGSYAKGNARLDSDIDIAVISDSFGKDEIEESGKCIIFIVIPVAEILLLRSTRRGRWKNSHLTLRISPLQNYYFGEGSGVRVSTPSLRATPEVWEYSAAKITTKILFFKPARNANA